MLTRDDEYQPLLPANPTARLDKKPRHISLRDLQEGDIVLFDKRWDEEPAAQGVIRRRHRKDITGETAVRGQSLYSEEGGHKEVIHAGFIAKHNDKLVLVHLIGKGLSIQSIHPDDELPGSFANRTSYVHRPCHFKHRPRVKELLAEKLQALLSEVVDAAHQGKKVKWRMKVALESIMWSVARRMKLRFRDPAKLTDDKSVTLTAAEINKSSICSKLVVDFYNTVCASMSAEDDEHYPYQARLMNVRGYVVPKTLQAYLYHNVNYKDFVMPVDGDLVLAVIFQYLRNEMEVLEAGNIHAKQIVNEWSNLMSGFQAQDNEDIIQQSIRFLRAANYLSPLPESVKFAAKRNGIYEKYYSGKPFIAYGKSDEDGHIKFSSQAFIQYNLSKTMSKQYHTFRKLGFSDRAAQIECSSKPTFSEWFQLNRTRKILFSVATLGIGHLGQYFYFLGIAHKIQKRNAALEQQAEAGYTNEMRMSLSNAMYTRPNDHMANF
jgi:hypothetical protein